MQVNGAPTCHLLRAAGTPHPAPRSRSRRSHPIGYSTLQEWLNGLGRCPLLVPVKTFALGVGGNPNGVVDLKERTVGLAPKLNAESL